MAVASKTWTAAYGPYVRLRITAQEVEVDVPNNRSKVRVTGQIYYSGGTRASNGYSQTYTVTVNGTQIGRQTGITYNLASGATRGLTTYTSGWISHNSNGAKSVTVRGHITDGHGDTGTISQSYALTTIARASTLNSFSMPNALKWNSSNTFSIDITRRSTSFTHEITLRDGSTNIATWYSVGTPGSLTLSAAQVNTLLNRTAGSATRTMTLRVQTKSGSTNIGSVLTRTATASIHSSARASVLNSFSMPWHLRPDQTTTFRLGITRRSSSFRHDIQLRDGSTTIASWTGQGTPETLNLTATQTNTLLSRMSSSTSRTMTLRVQTKSGSSNIGGALTRTATVYVYAEVKPVVWGLGVTIEANAHAKNNVKRFVQNVSRVSGNFSRNGTGGAWIISSKLDIRRGVGQDVQTINSNSGTFPRVVALSGPYQARGTATDSRGRTTDTGWVNLTNFDVLAYSVPQITEFTTNRRADTPTTVDVLRRGTHSGLSGSNILTIRLQQRASGTTSWTTVDPDRTTTSNSHGKDVPSTGHSVASSYEFRLYVFDQFGNSAERISTVSTQRVVLDIHKNEGVGIGKIHEKGVLDVDGAIYSSGARIDRAERFADTPFSGVDTATEWGKIPQGTYYVRPNNIENQPTAYGFMDVMNIEWADEYNIIWYEQTSGRVYRKTGYGTQHQNFDWQLIDGPESGTTSLGNWVRFNDGTQICYSSFTTSTTAMAAWGSMFYKDILLNRAFPKAFVEQPTVMATLWSSPGAYVGMLSRSATALTTLSLVRPVATPAGSYYVSYIAIGRWK